ncbi:MAG: ATP-dependent RNA helicase HrpA [Planctomycetota bacterium]|nr:ATP-dependent RNA helicase HrpA [Planctomycetota bacterium]
MPTVLPIHEHADHIRAALRDHRVLIVCGETGSGKTTQLPQICLEMGLADRGIIAHTQPRRLAARAVAARIAQERGEPLGRTVGVKVRFEEVASRQTRIKLLTDGMLLAELASDPALARYSTVIIDEAHERSLNIDFLLGCLRQLLRRRDDLRVIVTSATIDPARFRAFFAEHSVAPVVEVSGRMFPVEIRHRPPGAGGEDSDQVSSDAIVDAAFELLSLRRRSDAGDVLVFLPGEREIRLAADALRRAAVDADILPLFARLSSAEQDRVFHPSARPRVILATNIAETSLTVPGVRFVIDTGLARLSRYDPERRVQQLPIEPISRASASQRAGRCGRVAEGVCIRLYSESSLAVRPAFTDPEIHRTNLAGVLLQMKSLDLGPPRLFPFIDPPQEAALREGAQSLFELGATESADVDAPLTPLGARLARIPADPKVGRILLAAADEGCTREAVVLAAALSVQDPRERPAARQEQADRAHAVFRDETSDFLTLLKLWDQYTHAADTLSQGSLFSWCREHFLSLTRMREWADFASQLRQLAADLELPLSSAPAAADAIHRALLTGLITGAACREAGAGVYEYRAIRGNTVHIFPGSVLFRKSPRWIVAAEFVHTSRLFARTVGPIEPAWLEELAGHVLQRQLSDKHLDTDTGHPSAWERLSMSGVVIVPRRRAPLAPHDPAGARQIFLRDALAAALWRTDAPFMLHNRSLLAHAAQIEARLRRRNTLRPAEDVARLFAERLPQDVICPDSLRRWLGRAGPAAESALRLSLPDLLAADIDAGDLDARFPARISLHDPPAQPAPLHADLSYALAPGKDEDGITATITLADLNQISPERALWLVRGMLPELVLALFKTLPRHTRSQLEAQGPLDELARACAELMTFASGPLPAALSETVEALRDIAIDPALWTFKALPTHLRLRFRVVDEQAAEIAADRDLDALRHRLAGKAARARAALARARFERDHLTTWDFPALPDSVDQEDPAAPPLFPALVDRADHAALTLVSDARHAAQLTHRGTRRLFALACAAEAREHVRSLPDYADMQRNFAALGSAAELESDLITLIAERVFMTAHPPVSTQDQFQQRLQDQWGKLGPAAREVGEIVARTLEPRARIAQRFSGGTPRLWAGSVADIREHAAYLMPRGFLLLAPWDRLKHYPRYARAMRERLLALREEGSAVEKTALAELAPHWKRFTGWVARAMTESRADPDPAPAPAPAPAGSRPGKAPLPQARRAAPTVNLDAGEWAMQPGNLTPPVENYRWALEEYRAALFSPPAAAQRITPADLDALWKRVT